MNLRDKKTTKNSLRVLHVPMNTGGMATTLAAAQRRLGIDSNSVVLRPNKFGFQTDIALWSPGDSLLRREVKRLALIRRAIGEFDVIHYNAGTTISAPPLPPDGVIVSQHNDALRWVNWLYLTILQRIELALLKRAGKGIVVTYQGSEARQGDYCRQNYLIHNNLPNNSFYSRRSDGHKRRRINLIDRYADQIYSLNPDLLHVLPNRARFLPYCNVDLEQWQPKPSTPNKALRILHAPTNRDFKGSKYIIAAIDRLQEEGHIFEFDLVEGIAHKEARYRYSKADILIDQLLIGWYGGLSVEFMALGKPVICYIREEDLGYVSPQMREQLPIIQATPDSIYDVLKNCLELTTEELSDLGQRSRTFVENWHTPEIVAESLIETYMAICASKRERS